jgi:sortase A
LTIVALGIGISAWAWFGMRDPLPAQETPIASPTQQPTTTPTSTPGISPTPTASPTPTLPPVLYPVHPKLGARIGVITLPTLKLSWPIYEGTNETQLRKGVGHYVGSVLPGVRDNTILSGHRTTVFNRLGELKRGDLIYVQTRPGLFTYKVRSFKVVKRSDNTVIAPTKTAVLTLTTCYPFDNLGATTKAFLVTADLIASDLSR